MREQLQQRQQQKQAEQKREAAKERAEAQLLQRSPLAGKAAALATSGLRATALGAGGGAAGCCFGSFWLLRCLQVCAATDEARALLICQELPLTCFSADWPCLRPHSVQPRMCGHGTRPPQQQQPSSSPRRSSPCLERPAQVNRPFSSGSCRSVGRQRRLQQHTPGISSHSSRRRSSSLASLQSPNGSSSLAERCSPSRSSSSSSQASRHQAHSSQADQRSRSRSSQVRSSRSLSSQQPRNIPRQRLMQPTPCLLPGTLHSNHPRHVALRGRCPAARQRLRTKRQR